MSLLMSLDVMSQTRAKLPVRKILISGLGVMGASLAIAIRQNMPQIHIVGHDLADVLDEALAAGIIDETANWPADAATVDLIFLATPLGVLRSHIMDLNGVVSRNILVTDVGSTKGELAKWVQELGFSGTYVGGHPMTGAEKSGLKAANPLLYENAVYILTGVNRENKALTEEILIPILHALKSRVMFLSPQEHDIILAAISHLPQLAAIALINMVGQRNSEGRPYFELAAGGFRDLTRIASSSIDIWQDIIASNRENVASALRAFIQLLEEELEQLNDLRPSFEQANAFRSLVPKQSKGFLSPLKDILVYVTDEMGVVAKIANALSAENVDIRDIELLKIREKEGGVFRLSFSGEMEAQTAIKILNSIGYKAFIRE